MPTGSVNSIVSMNDLECSILTRGEKIYYLLEYNNDKLAIFFDSNDRLHCAVRILLDEIGASHILSGLKSIPHFFPYGPEEQVTKLPWSPPLAKRQGVPTTPRAH